MDLGVISVRYARALLKSAMVQKNEGKVYAEMEILSESYLDIPEFRTTIENPMLSNDKKQRLLETACGNDVSDLTRKFIALVLKEGREKALQFIAASYITLYRKQKNITRGKLTTATPVSREVEVKMQQMVESRTQGVVEFNTEVAPEIIGGFILEYDTYRMDASVKSKLHSILVELKK
ncbi:F0F1 ATP synthase subunit delta [Prevotella sp. KH2C16]|uniref:F0F1 ATP synthase subunit delta n=1 Tax=Prevotella sp. KH2C16 TaxID=1855325 RepID=UPI0008EC1D50|nr:F0F1 ATP synthase subunit delta [Prevotella sp. KH2C16]SFF97850.1 F-type H+-transporting ATPase subunit delta [Prevotella sp. KH2C16]